MRKIFIAIYYYILFDMLYDYVWLIYIYAYRVLFILYLLIIWKREHNLYKQISEEYNVLKLSYN